MKKLVLMLTIIILIVYGKVNGQNKGESQTNIKFRHSIEISPLSPLFKIYAVQYNYLLSERNEIMLGFAYANIKYDKGRSHAPTLILGYRRFFMERISY
ncbi:MAG: hypothetical protein ACLFQM_04610 [Fidelibacterota bacterium]